MNSQSPEPLVQGSFFHVYNCGINGCELYNNNVDKERFLQLFDRYIPPIADTYAWVLMGNHFHFLLKIKENICYRFSRSGVRSGGVVDLFKSTDSSLSSNAVRSGDADRFDEFDEIKWETMDLSKCNNPDQLRIPKPEKHLSHLFNAYSRYFNNKYDRHGNLFERPFKRKLVQSTRYLKTLILYIHNNPVHHKFCKRPEEYIFSSYLSYLSTERSELHHKVLKEWFDDEENFICLHDKKADFTNMEEWLGIG